MNSLAKAVQITVGVLEPRKGIVIIYCRRVSAADILQIATQDSIVARVARKAARRADPSAASDDVTGGEERSQQALRRTMAQQLGLLAANGLESWSGVLVWSPVLSGHWR